MGPFECPQFGVMWEPPAPIWGNEWGWPSRSRWCSWCGRYCGRTDESVVEIAVVNRETGKEGDMRLCPLCIYAPDATAESRKLWRWWAPRC
jgi:hypothetical protein